MTIAPRLREAVSDDDLRACWPVMRELRPHLAGSDEFVERVRRQHRDGYRLLAAWSGEEVVGLAGWRVQETLIRGRFCYVDDLVVRSGGRGAGLGGRLLDAVAEAARTHGLPWLVLDTGLENGLGQRFYFRHGMLPAALRFARPIGPS
jgi:ribosomal protein S18 acetylase RimI-like enzyme